MVGELHSDNNASKVSTLTEDATGPSTLNKVTPISSNFSFIIKYLRNTVGLRYLTTTTSRCLKYISTVECYTVMCYLDYLNDQQYLSRLKLRFQCSES